MYTTSKWFARILAIAILLTSTLTGGAKGTDYSVDIITIDAPIIDYIIPSTITFGSPAIIMYISGHNFDDSSNSMVRLRNPDTDQYLADHGMPEDIWVTIPDYLLTTPTTYTVTVIKYNSIIPIIPCVPPDCEESNPVFFWVVDFNKVYLPIIGR